MNFKGLLIAFVAAITLFSCSDDDLLPIPAKNSSKELIGEWESVAFVVQEFDTNGEEKNPIRKLIDNDQDKEIYTFSSPTAGSYKYYDYEQEMWITKNFSYQLNKDEIIFKFENTPHFGFEYALDKNLLKFVQEFETYDELSGKETKQISTTEFIKK